MSCPMHWPGVGKPRQTFDSDQGTGSGRSLLTLSLVSEEGGLDASLTL
jgi:hypothetical protein